MPNVAGYKDVSEPDESHRNSLLYGTHVPQGGYLPPVLCLTGLARRVNLLRVFGKSTDLPAIPAASRAILCPIAKQSTKRSRCGDVMAHMKAKARVSRFGDRQGYFPGQQIIGKAEPSRAVSQLADG